MTVGVWEPGKEDSPQQEVSADLLEKFLLAAMPLEESVSVEALEAAGVRDANWVMSAEAAAWQAASELETEQVIALARFFTLVEMQVAGWDAGKTSPVIPLVKLLKSRDAFTPALRKWIKAHTDNRFLPYGSAL